MSNSFLHFFSWIFGRLKKNHRFFRKKHLADSAALGSRLFQPTTVAETGGVPVFQRPPQCWRCIAGCLWMGRSQHSGRIGLRSLATVSEVASAEKTVSVFLRLPWKCFFPSYSNFFFEKIGNLWLFSFFGGGGSSWATWDVLVWLFSIQKGHRNPGVEFCT